MSNAGTRLQLTVKPAQMYKLNALLSGSYMSASQLFMMMIDAYYKKQFGTNEVHTPQEVGNEN